MPSGDTLFCLYINMYYEFMERGRCAWDLLINEVTKRESIYRIA